MRCSDNGLLKIPMCLFIRVIGDLFKPSLNNFVNIKKKKFLF
jgi:hypothetical protein